MHRWFLLLLYAVPLCFCPSVHADSMQLDGKVIDKVWITTDSFSYIIRDPEDGTTKSVERKLVNPESVHYSDSRQLQDKWLATITELKRREDRLKEEVVSKSAADARAAAAAQERDEENRQERIIEQSRQDQIRIETDNARLAEASRIAALKKAEEIRREQEQEEKRQHEERVSKGWSVFRSIFKLILIFGFAVTLLISGLRGLMNSGSARSAAKKTSPLWLAVLAIILFRICCGVFVIQPIGALPKGGTFLYWRFDLENMPFIASADGLLEKSGSGVSLLGRGVVLGTLADTITKRTFLTLPYSQTLYLISTGGKEYDR